MCIPAPTYNNSWYPTIIILIGMIVVGFVDYRTNASEAALLFWVWIGACLWSFVYWDHKGQSVSVTSAQAALLYATLDLLFGREVIVGYAMSIAVMVLGQ